MAVFTFDTKDEANAAIETMDVPVGTHPVRNHDSDKWHLADLDEKLLGEPDAVEPVTMREAQEGDVIVSLPPGLPAFVRMQVIELLKSKLDVPYVVMRDAMNLETVIETITKDSVKGIRAKSARVAMPNEKQAKTIELASRSQGVTAAELLAAGCGPNAKPRADSKSETVSWSQVVLSCVRFGYVFDSVKRHGQPTAYCLRAESVSEAAD